MADQEKTILNEFNALRPMLQEWGEFVDQELVKILEEDFIKSHKLKIYPKYRLKDSKSYLYKALYRQKPYNNPIVDIEDKIGTRLVLLKSDDIEPASQIISRHKVWDSRETKSVKEQIADKPNIFDYQSLHLVISPSEDSGYNEDMRSKLTCEIQIRTLLQHAFAEVSHDSTYKGPYKNDKEILRKLAKSMALMEATDDYFCSIFNMMTDQERYYSNYIFELIQLFQEYVPSFDRSNLQFSLTDTLLGLLTQKEISLADLKAYLTKNKEELKMVIRPKNGLLFEQPIILLVVYYFKKHRTFLKDNWPLSEESLKSVHKAFGVSFEHY